jgi:hypothetical protein
MICKCGELCIEGKRTCGRAACGSSTGNTMALGEMEAVVRDAMDRAGFPEPVEPLRPEGFMRTESTRPDFVGFAKKLREEAKWSAMIHSEDKTGQAASDQKRLLELADHVERVGSILGFI